MYEPGYDFSPIERQQKQQQQHILQKIDSAQLFQDALRVATYHPYNSPSSYFANSPLGGFTAAAAGYTPSSSFAAAALNVLNGMPPPSQFAQMQQQQQQQQQAENGSMTQNNHNNNDLTSIEDTQNNYDTIEPNVAGGMEQEKEREVEQTVQQKKEIGVLHNKSEVLSYSTIVNQSQNKIPKYAGSAQESQRKVQDHYHNHDKQGQSSSIPRFQTNQAHLNKSQFHSNQQHFPEYFSQQNFLPHHNDLLLHNHQQTQWHQQMQQNTNQHIPFYLCDNSQAITSGVGVGANSSITPQNIGRAFNYYDIPSIDSPQQGFTPSYYPSTASVTANPNSMLGSNFNNQQNSQQQQQQQPVGGASTSSASANYSFSSVAAALKNKSIHANVQQFYDSPRNFCGPSAFLPYTPQSVKASCYQSFMQAASDSLKLPMLHENDECSPINFLQTPVQQQQYFQESLTPRQIFNPTQHLQHHTQLQFQQQQQQQQHQQTTQIFQQSQGKQGLNLLQQQQQLKQMQRYNQEKALLQQQQFEIQQQARIASQQQFQNGSQNEQIQKEITPMEQQEQLQIETKKENISKQQQQTQDKVQKQIQQQLGVGKQDIYQTDSKVNQTAGSSAATLVDKEQRNKGKLQPTLEENQEQIEEEEDEENENNSEIQSEEDEDENENGEDDNEDGDEDYCENGKNLSKRRNTNGSLKNSNEQDLKKTKKISKKKSTNNKSQSKNHSRKQINETKNIPKNYSKAIIGFIQKHPDECSQLLGKDYSFNEFEKFLVDRKEKLTAIKDLRSLWTTRASNPKQETFNRVFRILSFKFFRENAVAYIYSSRKIKNTKALITYRFILQRALHDPESFQFMKLQN